MNDATRRKADSGGNQSGSSEYSSDKTLKFTMTPLAIAVVVALSPTATVVAQESEFRDEETKTLEVIKVTATRRELNLQDVPHSIDVLSAVDLARMGAKDLESTLKALPSVQLTALQPGQNSLVMRGISSGPYQYYTEAQVAVYLDEQPMTFSSQQVGIRNIDMARIENLPGPQGTLFGSSSQTGTLRYITNKPTSDGLLGHVEARYGTTSGGADSHELSGVINIPISDSFAIRAVGYTSLDGGYVDNVLGSSFSGNYDNANLVEEDFNEYEVDGGRIHALWNMSDSWSALLTVVAENTKADGVWDSDEALGDYKVTRFEDEIRTDDWVSSSLTLEGDLGFADLSFTYSRFDRDIVYEYDNMTYQQSKDYYYYAGYVGLYHTDYYRSTIFNDQYQERDAFEMRLVSSGEGRFQWMAGGYYEDILDHWFYGNKTPGLTNTTAWYYAQAYADYYGGSGFYDYDCYCYQTNPNIQYPLAPTDVFYSDTLHRTLTQTAVFSELSFDLTNDLTVHGGIRWAEYERDSFEGNGVPDGLPPFGDRFTGDGFYRNVGTDSDTIYKLGLRYNFSDDVMVYGLFSQGFRVGGFNSIRASNTGALPLNYNGDLIDNYELGVKSQFLNNRLTFNASAFAMVWNDYQDSTNGDAWWLRGNVNVGDAETLGLEVQVDWQATDRLTLSANVFAASAEFSDNFCAGFVGGIQQPCPVDGNGNIDPDALDIRAGMPLPNAPETYAHASINYSIPDVFNGELWIYYDFSYSSKVWSETDDIVENNTDGLAPSWTYSTLSAGLQLPNQWDIEVNVRNLFDEDGYSYVWTGEASNAAVFDDPRYRKIRAQERPRTVWLTVRKGFGGI